MEFTPLMQNDDAQAHKKSAYTTVSQQHDTIEKWKKSGLLQAAFCQREGIHQKTFSRWLAKSQQLFPKTLKGEVGSERPEPAAAQHYLVEIR